MVSRRTWGSGINSTLKQDCPEPVIRVSETPAVQVASPEHRAARLKWRPLYSASFESGSFAIAILNAASIVW